MKGSLNTRILMLYGKYVRLARLFSDPVMFKARKTCILLPWTLLSIEYFLLNNFRTTVCGKSV